MVYALHTVAMIVGIVGVATVIGRFVGSLPSLLAVTGESRLLVLTGELLELMKRRE